MVDSGEKNILELITTNTSILSLINKNSYYTQNIIYLIPLDHKKVISASSLGQDWQKSWLYK